MEKFMFLTYGFVKPDEEAMAKWQQWFTSVSDRIIEQGFFPQGAEIDASGTNALPLERHSITGYMLFHATDLQEATKLAEQCPFVDSNRVYAIKG